MLNPIEYVQTLNKRIARTSFVFILIAIAVYFYVNGPAYFQNWDSSYGQLISIYLLMTVVFLVWSGRETKKEIERPVYESLTGFAIFFIGTYFLLFSATYLSGSTITPLPKEVFWPTVIIQICVVATPEELMFRGVLLEKFGILISSFLFAIWHLYAYNLIFYAPETIGVESLFSVGLAFIMGIILAVVTKKWGINGAIAIHACYNLFVSGAFVTVALL